MSPPVTNALSIESFLRLYPRSAEELESSGAKGREPLDWLWHYDLSVSGADLWPLVTDTSRLNRAIGYPEMEFTEEGGILYGAIPADGQRWVELPWDWNFPHSVICERRYLKGMISYYRGIMHLEEFYDQGITRVYVCLTWVLRTNRIKDRFKQAFDPRGDDYGRVLRSMEENIVRKRERFAGITPPVDTPTGEKVRSIRAVLLEAGGPADLVDALINHVMSAPEEDLDKIRPRELARRWSRPQDAREIIRLCVHAVQAGLLTMSWDVICPHCRGDRQRLPSLGRVPLRGYCDVCEIDFDNNTVNSLEISFHVHVSVRDIKKRWYCSAEPATKPHIKVQQTLPPGTSRDIQTMLGVGSYRMRVQGRDGYRMLEINHDSADFELQWNEQENIAYSESMPSPRLMLRNTSDEDRAFVLEDTAWDRDALKPADLFNLADYRDLFAEEALASDLHLEVGEQTIVFTDIVNSTGFYDSKGDALAFALIRDHFQKLFAAADENGGAVVKTIGDAAMAAFSEPADAVRAALTMRGAFGPGAALRLRISVHTGPCIAVHLNTGMDYFGRTVNLAAKLQGMAGAGQIVLTNTVHDAPGVSELLKPFSPSPASYGPPEPHAEVPVFMLSDAGTM